MAKKKMKKKVAKKKTVEKKGKEQKQIETLTLQLEKASSVGERLGKKVSLLIEQLNTICHKSPEVVRRVTINSPNGTRTVEETLSTEDMNHQKL